MIIPYQQLSTDTLRGLIEEYVTRDGTDYGEQEASLEQKVQHIERQLKKGDVVIVFETASETVSLLTKHDAELLTSI